MKVPRGFESHPLRSRVLYAEQFLEKSAKSARVRRLVGFKATGERLMWEIRGRSRRLSPFRILAVDFGAMSADLSAAGRAHAQSATPECFDALAAWRDSIRRRLSQRSKIG